jgi:uncharacterized phage protein (TIGR02218 family)
MSSYSDFEYSAHEGRPVELYRFAHGGDVWAYSNGPGAEYNDETYLAFAIGRDGLEQSAEIHRSDLTVSVPRSSPISMLYLVGNPESVVSVTVYRQHIGAAGTMVYWRGRVTGATWDGASCKLTCENIFTSLRRPGLRARYQRMCRHALYRHGCGVDMASHAVGGTVSAVDSRTTVLTIPEAAALPDGWFTGGMLTTPTGGWLFVVGHEGSVVTVQHPCRLGVSDGVTLYPGCDRSRETCAAKFGNILNFGGYPWIPQRNPFDGRSIV